MLTQHILCARLFGLRNLAIFLLCVSVCLIAQQAHARNITIAFIQDGAEAPNARLSSLIVKELQPLLPSEDAIEAIVLGAEDESPNVLNSLAKALADPNIDYIVSTGLIGSQEIYKIPQFAKPVYLLSVIDPKLTGAPIRDNVRNLRSYSTVNEIAQVANRLSELFQAKRVAIILPEQAIQARRSIEGAVETASKSAGIETHFLSLDFGTDIESQLSDLDAVILPPVGLTKQDLSALLKALQRKKIPSFAVGGDSMVLSGALISDTLEEDERVLARKVALDLQLAISGDARPQGMSLLEPKKRTTINIDTARALGIDFSLDELLTARIVRGNSDASTLGFLASLELSTNRNLSLRGQSQQLQIDEESLQQAIAERRPQLSSQLEYTRRGDALPEQDTLAAIGLSQTIYSTSVNAGIKVAELGVQAAQKLLEQTQLETIQNTASAYFQALQSQAQFESSLRDLAFNRENLTLAEQRNRSGSGSGAEIYRWHAVIAASETQVLRAYTTNNSAQHALAQLLNTRLDVPTTLKDVDVDEPPFDVLHAGIEPYLNNIGQAELLREASAERALAQSPQLDSVSANVAINKTLLNATRRSYYTPELSLSAQYAHYLDSTDNAMGVQLDNENDWSLSLTAKLPLWVGGSRSSLIRQYAVQSELADTQLQSLQIALWANSSDAVNNLVTNYRAIGLSDRAEEAARRSQEITQNAYKLGSASVTELLDTQNEYREAQDNTHIARYQYLTALVDFQALMGEMPMLDSQAEQQRWLQNLKQSMLEVSQK